LGSAIAAVGVGDWVLYTAVTPAASLASTLPTADRVLPGPLLTLAVALRLLNVITCVWAGRLLVTSVAVSVPPTCPSVKPANPGPCPAPIGTRPCRSGNANVVC